MTLTEAEVADLRRIETAVRGLIKNVIAMQTTAGQDAVYDWDTDRGKAWFPVR